MRIGEVALATLLVVAMVVGCASVKQGTTTASIEVEPGSTTREDVYRSLGPPHAISVQATGETLVYRHVRTQGLGAGVAILLTPFEIGNRRSQTDSVFIDLARNDVVIRVRRHGGEASPGWSIWPWGAGSSSD